MDRNSTASETGAATIVALRKESVDRNVNGVLLNVHDLQSLSARRAWIEIWVVQRRRRPPSSLSARRAWIEIIVCAATPTARIGRSPQGERG